MVPQSHLADSHDLAAVILSAATPTQIVAACSAAESYLRKHPADFGRSFFSSFAFTSLLRRLFGFHDPSAPPSPPWIELPDPNVASRIFDLLAPGGALMSCADSIDSKSLVRFAFPFERLPKWMGYLLLQDGRCHAVLSDICPLFKGRIGLDAVKGNNQLQLNVFEYYIFWFAYYPLCKGPCENSSAVVGSRKGIFRLERWTSPWPALSSGRHQMNQKKECGLYLRLLNEYLYAFVPRFSIGLWQQQRSSLLHYSPSFDASAMSQSEFIVHTFICFWMVDNDFSPLPVQLCKLLGVSFPMLKAFAKVPPSMELGEPLRLVVNYLNGGLRWSGEGANQVELSGRVVRSGSRPPAVGKLASGSWNSSIQRPLYRFILRTFLFCPMGTPMENVSQVFSLWINYLEPWKESWERCTEPNSTETQNQGSNTVVWKEDKSNADTIYSSVWDEYILSNFLFYSTLVAHFLSFAHKFLHTNTETIIQMTLKVIDILISSKELADLLKKIHGAYTLKALGSSLVTFEGSYTHLPSIYEQLQDWEDGSFDIVADGNFSHENQNRDLKLFSDSEGGVSKLLQLLILRAETEIRALPGDSEARSLPNLVSLKAKASLLFDIPNSSFQSPMPTKAGRDTHIYGEDEIFTPKHPRIGRSSLANTKYEGDWMRSPITEDEIAWLARFFVRLSDLLNELLGLDSSRRVKISSESTLIEMPHDKASTLDGFWMFIPLLGSWIALLFRVVTGFIRGRGWRINLRMLASKKVITALLAYTSFSVVRRTFGAYLMSVSL